MKIISKNLWILKAKISIWNMMKLKNADSILKKIIEKEVKIKRIKHL